MSQLQHSPGPWSVHTDTEGWKEIVDADGRFIAEIGRDLRPDSRLMLAAPDMLRMLRVLSEKSESGADTKDEWYVWRDAMQEAKALIARLDGGE